VNGWQPGFLTRHPAFAALAEVVCDLADLPDWPTLERLDVLARERGLATAAGLPLRFAAEASNAGYERHIGACGAVSTRAKNWHDLFNALAWFAWPKSKAALNARHLRELETGAARVRGPVRDALTLFDESGLVVLCANPRLRALLENHAWVELFRLRRHAVMRDMRFLAFGHALVEKLLDPYPAITAKCWFIETRRDELDAPAGELTALADARLATALATDRLAPARLPPLPVLGIPGWWPDNERADFYFDRAVFRPAKPTGTSARLDPPQV
jgi:hypothetical protein